MVLRSKAEETAELLAQVAPGDRVRLSRAALARILRMNGIEDWVGLDRSFLVRQFDRHFTVMSIDTRDDVLCAFVRQYAADFSFYLPIWAFEKVDDTDSNS